MLMRDVIQRVPPSIGLVEVKGASDSDPWRRSGTGFAISAGGMIATCNHVVADWTYYRVTINGGTYEARRAKERVSADIAILRVDADTRPLVLGDLRRAAAGDDVVWCGFTNHDSLLNFHRGMLSYVGAVRIPQATGELSGFVLDGTVNRGNSGGPVINPDDGSVIGVVTASLGRIQEGLEALKHHEPQGTVILDQVDPIAALKAVASDLSEYLQIGVGYGIDVAYLARLNER